MNLEKKTQDAHRTVSQTNQINVPVDLLTKQSLMGLTQAFLYPVEVEREEHTRNKREKYIDKYVVLTDQKGIEEYISSFDFVDDRRRERGN